MKKHEIEAIVNDAIKKQFDDLGDRVLGRVDNAEYTRLINKEMGTSEMFYHCPHSEDDYPVTKRNRADALTIATQLMPREMEFDELFSFADKFLLYLTGEWHDSKS